MTSQNKCNLLRFSVVLWAPPTQMTTYDQKYENDRKNMGNLLIQKLKKMLIFDQKILEFSITNLVPRHYGNGSTIRMII